MKLGTYQQQVGLVMQETYLFGGTIRDNLLFMNPYASQDDLETIIRKEEPAELILCTQLPGEGLRPKRLYVR